jgi:heme A synthase
MPIAIHFAHRLGALLIVLGVFDVARRVFMHHRHEGELSRPVRLLVLAVLVQATLGAYVVLTAKNEIVNTLHVANGAITLGTSLVLTLRLYHRSRPALPPAAEQVAA